MLPRRTTITLTATGPALPLRPATHRYDNGIRRLVAATVPASDQHWPNLHYYDAWVLNTSGGKDSGAAAHHFIQIATAAGVLGRGIFLHNDLGAIEWPGTAALDAQHADHYQAMFGATLVELYGDRPGAADLARQHADRYGIPFVVRSRLQGDLLAQIEQYGKFPDAANRHCTSEQKRAPKHRLFTELVKDASLGRKMRILDINGERADESTARARKPAFEHNRVASNKTKRDVWTWRIIHDWSIDQVWALHRAQNIPYAWTYDAGMSRFSCSTCVLGSKADLTLAGRLRPDLIDRIGHLEDRIGHLFKHKTSIRTFLPDGYTPSCQPAAATA
ncbi:phosphoadenosine phosphosulfate reductase family protein [Planobispora siamensis]|uniref:Phosphoadenosine phosphosulphate reductase domain-containing protein n=1 Tax=Planobispora siamensis TaxID=936338 RepID=A0A8J3WLH9_9ACTN|nr:phosphoadenosine phosphosulfate reductase family protein [Planobispora siamensis]GIH95314.1 hypothetical protein Psi01_59440 [Planobispora siamensis]